MNKGVWDIPEPKPERPAVEPDILLVPLLAFDDAGRRLGYGGGFYDRTLTGLRARKASVAVGLAYDEQRIDAVPHLDYDQQLDWVLTPSGPIRCSSHASAVPR
jgi:5-formyltetrahydrofolate cyclo-ligase